MVPAPPVGVAVAVPVVPPLHNTSVSVTATVKPPVLVMVTVSVSVHELPSVAVTVYVPAARPVMVAVVAPVDHIKVMVPVPPVALAVAEPGVEHEPLVPAMLATTAVGAVIVAEPVTVQPEASVAVTV